MIAVSTLLQPADIRGLNISGFNDRCLFNGSWRLTSVTLVGEIELLGILAIVPRAARQP
jgi:hypothetical protein